jgi:hypothetical protein
MVGNLNKVILLPIFVLISILSFLPHDAHGISSQANNAVANLQTVLAGKASGGTSVSNIVLSAQGNTFSINLSWTGGAGSPTGYLIERSLDGITFSTLSANTKSTLTVFSDITVNPSITYYYRVSAISAQGTSAPSKIANATTGEHLLSSGLVVTPPTFGGGNPLDTYQDGLKITQNGAALTYDISNYFQDIKRQVLLANTPTVFTIKTSDPYHPFAVVHAELFFIPKGEEMLVTNSIATIEWNKDMTPIVTGNSLIKNTDAYMTSDGEHQFISFYFTPAKSFKTMNFKVRVFNDHRYSSDVNIGDASPVLKLPEVYPKGVAKYTNLSTLSDAIQSDKYYKPQMSHIQSTDSVFNGIDSGQVFWLYNTKTHAVTLITKDVDGNIVYQDTAPLKKMNAAYPNACDEIQFKPFCTNNGFYNHQGTVKLTKDQVLHMVRMGMWEGKLPAYLFPMKN